MQPNQHTWKTKDGQVIPVSQLEDSHLNNIINMLERHAKLFRQEMSFPAFQGEMAQFTAERDFDMIMAMDEEELVNLLTEETPMIENLYKELYKRGLR